MRDTLSRGRGFFRPRLVTAGECPPTETATAVNSAGRFRSEILPHLDSAYNFACYLAADHLVAEVLVQDAFLRAFRGFDGYQGGSPRSWLFAIVRNCWRDRIKAERSRGQVMVDQAGLSAAQTRAVDNHPDDADTPEASLIRQREIDTVRTVIASIPEPFREALVLREMEAMSYRQIAAVTDVPIGTVMSRLARARGMLAKLLLSQVGPYEQQGAGA